MRDQPTDQTSAFVGDTMTSNEMSNEAKNEMKVMVLTDLAAFCKKLADSSAVTEEMREQAREFVEKYNSLAQFRGKGSGFQHYEAELLIYRIAGLLRRVLEIESHPANV